MASRPSSLFVADQYVSSPSLNLPPPPPRSGEGPRPQGRRRDHVVRLPSLTTNLPPQSAPSHLLTPLSTSSLSSPFTQSQTGPHSASPAAVSRGVSPMALRSTYSVPYNPSEWTSGGRRSSQVDTRSGAQAEEGLTAPPPPYSPPRSQRPRSIAASTILSTADNSLSPDPQPSPRVTTTPGVLSPVSAGTSLKDSSMSMRDSGTSFSSGAASPMNLPPPPPRKPGSENHRPALTTNRSRPMSVSALSQVMTIATRFGQSEGRPEAEDVGEAERPPNAKRAASAGDVSTEGSRAPSADSRSSSHNRGWHPGLPLPGPPPGLPPASSRSQSASKVGDSARRVSPGPSSRPHSHRAPLKPPVLSPMPPTPAGWTEDQPLRPVGRAAVPLYINTNVGSSSGHRDVHPASDSIIDPSPAPSLLGLSRSAALRDSSAKGLRERRNLRRSINDLDAQRPLVVSTNPWADATTSAASTARSPTTFSDVTGPNESQMTSPVLERSYGSLQKRPVMTSPYHEVGMSPLSPLRRSSRPPFDDTPQNQVKALPTPPLSQKAPASARSVHTSTSTFFANVQLDTDDDFMTESLQRHRGFLAREGAAISDAEKLQVFADYVVAESVLRQKRYSAAISSGDANVEGIRRRLFDDSDPSAKDVLQSLRSLNTPGTSSSSRFQEDNVPRGESGWYKEYKPALSPIASMSNDGISSRGRTSSRWWESQGGSQTDAAGGQKVRRSKRESKYMGLSTNLMNSSIEETEDPAYFGVPAYAGNGSFPNEKANPETFGMYDNGEPELRRDSSYLDPDLLDISRLITLPPPYPRHYPAVNNSHPDLASYRLTVRGLSDLSEIKARKSRHVVSLEAMRNEHKQKVANVRQEFKSNVNAQIEEGTITYAEAAEAEQALRQEEFQAEKETLQAEFDTLQDVVIKPLHEMLNDRLVQLSSHIGELTEKLQMDAQHENPDRPQQEGDDTPELLEYLTQLKWLFETREQTHKELFDLLTERNENYKAIVMLPYRQANNPDKVRGTEAFFAQDRADRQKAYFAEALARHKDFFGTVEDHVSLGVQLQSSAFWDIAPSLMEILQTMPEEVPSLNRIAIPETEYLENPSYYRFPQQYLYTLLNHAEKSTYQFIESQINLHCLLHEVKSSLVLAQCREMESKLNPLPSPKSTTTPSTALYRSKEEALLTAELKQKVSIIEQQWLEALGSQLQEARERVKVFLQEQGGWEEMVEHAKE